MIGSGRVSKNLLVRYARARTTGILEGSTLTEGVNVTLTCKNPMVGV